jgi:hypothetical protein
MTWLTDHRLLILGTVFTLICAVAVLIGWGGFLWRWGRRRMALVRRRRADREAVVELERVERMGPHERAEYERRRDPEWPHDWKPLN